MKLIDGDALLDALGEIADQLSREGNHEIAIGVGMAKLAVDIAPAIDAALAVSWPWVPVKERLPQEFVSVLVYIPTESHLPTVKEAYLANGAWATKMAIYFMEEVTHWMPMPQPPKEV